MTLASRTSEVRFVKKGDKGAKLRMRDWKTGVSYLCGNQGEDFYDVVFYNTKLYLCIKSHTSSSANNPQTSVSGNLGFWALATDWQFVATKLLLAEKITADQIDADGITAKDVNLTGTIYADSGYCRGIIETAASGTCIVIDPSKNSLQMYDSKQQSLLKMGFYEDGTWGDTCAQIYMYRYYSSDSSYQIYGVIQADSISMVSGTDEIKISPVTGFRVGRSSSDNIRIYKSGISIRSGSSTYSGRSASFNLGTGLGTLRFINGILVE